MATHYVRFPPGTAESAPTAGGFGEFTTDGPIAHTLQPLRHDVRFPVTYGQGQERLTYGLSADGELVKVDHVLRAELPRIAVDRQLCKSGRVWTLALDSQRGRLLCSGRDDIPSLLAYDLRSQQWSLFATPPRHVHGLAHDAKCDAVVAIVPNFDAQRSQFAPGSRLLIYDAEGKLLRQVASPCTIAPAMRYRQPNVQLAVVAGRLVVLAPPSARDPCGLAGRIHVLDLTTGEVLHSAPPQLHDGQTTRPAMAAERADLRRLRFRAVHRALGVQGKATIGFTDFTLKGPLLEQLVPVFHSYARYAHDAAKNGIYVLYGNDVAQLTPETGGCSELPLDDSLPPLQRTCGLTFDAKRRRLLVATENWFLYAYDVDARQWSLVTSLRGRDMTALVHDPRLDLLYGLYREGDGQAQLLTMNPHGALLRRVPVSIPEFGRGYESLTQLAAAGDYVAMIWPERFDSQRLPQPALLRLFDPLTGAHVYSGRLTRQVVPVKLAAKELERLWERLLASDAHEADETAWQMTAGGDAAAAFLADKLAQGAAKSDPAMARQLIARLDSPKFAEREQATRQLANLGGDVQAELDRHAQHPSPEVRTRIAKLNKLLQNPTAPMNPTLRRWILSVQILERIGSPTAMLLLQRVEATSRREVAQAAATALHRLNGL